MEKPMPVRVVGISVPLGDLVALAVMGSIAGLVGAAFLAAVGVVLSFVGVVVLAILR